MKKYCRIEHATDDNMTRAHYMLDTHTLRIRNTYCFPTATIIPRTRPNVTLQLAPPPSSSNP